jgi:hypothetical protein
VIDILGLLLLRKKWKTHLMLEAAKVNTHASGVSNQKSTTLLYNFTSPWYHGGDAKRRQRGV